MGILRDSMYTDRILAVLREYGANAWDAHRDAGKPDLPIKVTLPTDEEPTLTIRDYGNGMSQEDVFTVYTQYGASTKRGSDVAVGMLGIGCKSAFAYADSFTISSWHGGEKRIYAAALDVTNKGVMNLLHTEPCGKETGVEIKLAIKREDRYEFEHKATTLFYYFKPRPEINVELVALPEDVPLKNGCIRQGYGEWVAVMGCIPYRVSLNQLNDDIMPAVRHHHGELYFNIGDVTVSASREELRYSKETKAALIQKFASLVDEYVTTTLAEIKGTAGTAWSRRLKAQTLRGLLSGVPAEDHGLLSAELPLTGKIPDKANVIVSNSTAANSLTVQHTTRLILRDTRKRSLKGYHLLHNDRVFDGTEAKLNEFIAGLGIDGIPTIKLSELAWTPTSRRKNNHVEQHKQSCFMLVSGRLCSHGSTNWTGVSREPQDTDVFVVLDCFKVRCHSDFGHSVNRDRALAKRFKVPFPEVYGYKTTASKPVHRDDCKGTHYDVWREDFVEKLVTPELLDLATKRAVATAFEETDYAWKFREGFGPNWAALRKGLGPAHPITEVLRHYAEGREDNRADEDDMRELYEKAKKLITVDVDAPVKRGRKLLKKYPLLRGWNDLWKHADRVEAWIEYIKLKDAHAPP